MAQNAEEVDVAVDGYIFWYPTTTPAPTGIDSDLPVAAIDLGYADEGGVTQSTSSSSVDITAWQRSAKVRRLMTEGECTLAFNLIQDNEQVRAFYHGGAKAADGSYKINPTKSGGRKSIEVWAIDEENGKLIRSYFQSAEVTERGDQVYVSNDAIKFSLTLTAYPDAAGNCGSVWVGDIPEGLLESINA